MGYIFKGTDKFAYTLEDGYFFGQYFNFICDGDSKKIIVESKDEE